METEGETLYGASWLKRQKDKRSFCILSHSTVLPESNSFISLLVIGSQALSFGIDLKWNEFQPKLVFDTVDPLKYNSADWYDMVGQINRKQ